MIKELENFFSDFENRFRAVFFVRLFDHCFIKDNAPTAFAVGSKSESWTKQSENASASADVKIFSKTELPDYQDFRIFDNFAEYVTATMQFGQRIEFDTIDVGSKGRIEKTLQRLADITIKVNLSKKVWSGEKFHQEFFRFDNVKIIEDYKCSHYFDDDLPPKTVKTRGYVIFSDWIDYCIGQNWIGFDLEHRMNARPDKICFSEADFVRHRPGYWWQSKITTARGGGFILFALEGAPLLASFLLHRINCLATFRFPFLYSLAI